LRKIILRWETKRLHLTPRPYALHSGHDLPNRPHPRSLLRPKPRAPSPFLDRSYCVLHVLYPELNCTMAIDNTQLQALVTDLEAKEQSLADAGAANDAAQAAAQASIANAAGTLATKNTAHDALTASVDALVAFVNALKA
jgi:hypothetical protein